MINDLINLGFSQHEAEIYLALVNIGQTGAGGIIKKTGLHRNIGYETLDKLITKQLATKTIRKNIAQFKATNPNRIIENEKARLGIAEGVVPELNSLIKTKQDIVIWDGPEGFRQFTLKMIEQIKYEGTIYVLGSVGDRWWELMGDAAKTYKRIKNRNRISWKMVAFVESELDRISMDENKNDYDEIRLLSQSSTPPANMIIWEDSIALQTFTPPYSVIEIKNKVLAEAYLNYFNAMWKQAKPIK